MCATSRHSYCEFLIISIFGGYRFRIISFPKKKILKLLIRNFNIISNHVHTRRSGAQQPDLPQLPPERDHAHRAKGLHQDALDSADHVPDLPLSLRMLSVLH